jgi:hypothetical protein
MGTSIDPDIESARCASSSVSVGFGGKDTLAGSGAFGARVGSARGTAAGRWETGPASFREEGFPPSCCAAFGSNGSDIANTKFTASTKQTSLA